MTLTRNRFFAALAGLVGLGAAKGQTFSSGMTCISFGADGKQKPIKCPESAIVPVKRLGWPEASGPLNGQCPLCGTVKPTLVIWSRYQIPRELTMDFRGMDILTFREDGHMIREDGKPLSVPVRCDYCRCSFWQDAE